MTADTTPAQVLVTGGGGFIGAATVGVLQKAGHRVLAGFRRATSDLPNGSCICDLDNPKETRDAVAGTRLVVHAAYGASEAMAAQCANLLDAMSAAGVTSLVHLSSIAVYGDRTGVVDETCDATGRVDAYGVAKIECERLVRSWAENAAYPDRRALILRPGIVYGAGSRFWIDKLVERIRRGAWGVFPGADDAKAALVHVDDLTALIAIAASRLLAHDRPDWPRATALNIVGPETPSWNDYFRSLAHALGLPELGTLDAGTIAARQKIAMAAKVWRRVGLPGGEVAALAPTPGEIDLFTRKAEYSAAAAHRLIGFSPRVTLAEGVAKSIAGP